MLDLDDEKMVLYYPKIKELSAKSNKPLAVHNNTVFFQMLKDPLSHGEKFGIKYHPHLEVGPHVRVCLPVAVTETLKITVFGDMREEGRGSGREQKKNKMSRCAPYLILPENVIKEEDNSGEYKNVLLIMYVQIGTENYGLPIGGCTGQRRKTKETKRVIPYLEGQEVVVFFSKARMPTACIKQEFQRFGVSEVSFFFVVDNMVVRDNTRRVAQIYASNSVGINQTKAALELAYRHHTQLNMMHPINPHLPNNNSPSVSKKRKTDGDAIIKDISYLFDGKLPDGVQNLPNIFTLDQLQKFNETMLQPLKRKRQHEEDTDKYFNLESELLQQCIIK